MNLTVRQLNKTWQWIVSYKSTEGKWKQKSKSGYRTKDEAKNAGNSFMMGFVIPSNETFKGIADIYISIVKRAYNTTVIYKNMLKHLQPIHNMKLNEISYELAQELINEFYIGHKHKTTKDLMTFARSVFNFASKRLKTKVDNPFAYVEIKEIQGKGKKTIKTYTVDQISAFIDSINGNQAQVCKLYTLFAGYMGLRISEIRGLTNGCIDYKNKTVKIFQQRGEEQSGPYEFKALKSKHSYRTLKLPESIKKELQGYAIPINKKAPLLPSLRSRELIALYKKNNCLLTPHEFRHSFATNLIQRGVDLRTVAKMMGDTLETVIRNYSHVNTDMQKTADDIISNF